MAPHGLQDLMVAKPDAYPHIAKLLSGTRHACKPYSLCDQGANCQPH